jgi:hypothetical protein
MTTEGNGKVNPKYLRGGMQIAGFGFLTAMFLDGLHFMSGAAPAVPMIMELCLGVVCVLWAQKLSGDAKVR